MRNMSSQDSSDRPDFDWPTKYDERDDEYGRCEPCEMIVYDAQRCIVCGDDVKYCPEHRVKCSACDEQVCHEHAPEGWCIRCRAEEAVNV